MYFEGCCSDMGGMGSDIPADKLLEIAQGETCAVFPAYLFLRHYLATWRDAVLGHDPVRCTFRVSLGPR